MHSDKYLQRTRILLEEVRTISYPELHGVKIHVRTFRSDADYFRVCFDVLRFLTGQEMRSIIKVKTKVFELNAPEEGMRAIIAHELGHILYFKQKKRIQILSMVYLLSRKHMARFERWTDLQAVSRGYGEGLKEYRKWLYRNVSPQKLAAKRRNYLSPEELDAIIRLIAKRPEFINYLFKNVPLNLKEITESK